MRERKQEYEKLRIRRLKEPEININVLLIYRNNMPCCQSGKVCHLAGVGAQMLIVYNKRRVRLSNKLEM